MTRAAQAIRLLVVRIAGAFGIEGAFLATGTALLAVASSFISPAGPWFVVGGMCLLAGVALALPARRG